MCEDPATGEVIVRPQKGCPHGYVERVKRIIKDRGMLFRDPRNEED